MAFTPPGGAPPATGQAAAGVPTVVGPLRRKPVVMTETAFEFTAQDVLDGAEDLAKLVPGPIVPIESSGPILSFILMGNRNSKTVASIAVNTTHCRGLDRPPGSKVVVVYWDTQCKSSFDNWLENSGVKLAPGEEYPIFIGMRSQRGRYLGMEDAGDPACRTYMNLVFKELLKSLKARRDIGGFVTDRAEVYIEENGADMALYYAGASDFSDLQPSQWKVRNKMWASVDELVRTVVIPGGWVGVNGPLDKREGDKTMVIGPGGKRTQEVVPSKWASRIGSNYPVEIRSYYTRDEEGAGHWVYDCTVGRFQGFQEGRKIDGKNKSVGGFLE